MAELVEVVALSHNRNSVGHQRVLLLLGDKILEDQVHDNSRSPQCCRLCPLNYKDYGEVTVSNHLANEVTVSC